MKRKIVWLVVFLIAGGGFFLWWLGSKTLESERLAMIVAETEASKVATKQLEQIVQAISTPALATITQALVDKKAPFAKLEEQKTKENQYVLADLRVGEKDTSALKTSYQNQLKKILTDYKNGLVSDETGAMHNLLENNDPAAEKLLLAALQNNQNILSRLVLVTVPPSASLLQLNLLNSLANLGQIIYNMSQVRQEPLLAVESAEKRNEKYLAVVTAIAAIDHYLAKPVTIK